MSVLWLTGAPGVGKSTVSWALYLWATARGRPVAYVDIDQLGLLVPAPPGDPEYHRLKATNLIAVIDTFRDHGAQQLIVSGVVDSHRGIDPYVRTARDVEFTLVRLRCAREELRRRYLERGSSVERLEGAIAFADALDRSAVGLPLDITTMSPGAVVEALADRVPLATQTHPILRPASAPIAPAPEGPASVLLLAGPTAVGKSTVGWEVFRMLWSRNIPAAYIDVDQLGFHQSDSAPNAKVDNLIRVWRGYRDAGARALVVVARGTPHPYRNAFADEAVTIAYLEASPSALAERIAQRARGHGPELAGDSLVGASAQQQMRTIARSTEETAVLRRSRGEALVIDTDNESSSEVAAKLADLF
ncbi:AAA family ATPase [Nocardia pneumoniae]|uniref:AAA family ATPase n=1 Tax=Nocardia pneumoniae TaxID=228601 RepID=UPI0002DE81D9|nr:AAA family ATPase [Nocardia pneumoniae]